MWLEQARSDSAAAAALSQTGRPEFHCQVVAKYQQVVEKAIKGLRRALADHGETSMPPALKHQVAPLLSALLRLPAPDGSLLAKVRQGLSGLRSEVERLCALAPRTDEQGELTVRNTEYPYCRTDGEWKAPASAGEFTEQHVSAAERTATAVLRCVQPVVTAATRAPRPLR